MIAAPFFCAASVNAQSIQPKLEGVSTSNVFQSPTLQTRAEAQTARPDSVVVEEYGEIKSKDVYKYDDAGRMVEWINYANTPLVPVNKYLYEYGENGKLSKVNITYWDGTQWIPLCVENYTYDEQGRQIRYDFDRVALEGVSENVMLFILRSMREIKLLRYRRIQLGIKSRMTTMWRIKIH